MVDGIAQLGMKGWGGWGGCDEKQGAQLIPLTIIFLFTSFEQTIFHDERKPTVNRKVLLVVPEMRLGGDGRVLS